MTSREQPFVVRLDATLARRALSMVGDPEHSYESLDELVTVALVNQLNLDTPAEGTIGVARRHRDAPQIHGLLERPAASPPATPFASPLEPLDPLFILTNRLSPLKVATRVLANLQPMVLRLPGNPLWPSAKTFRTTAGQAARALGDELRAHDRQAQATGRARRWTGYPVGRDERSSLERFAVSFTLPSTTAGTPGPLSILGLAATIDGDRVALTESGWRLALAPSPLLDGAPGETLSDEEREIFVEQIHRAPGERQAVREFLELILRANGSQPSVDEMLAALHPAWSENRTIAQRAALIGRLGELRMLDATGRGTSARLRVLPEGEQFIT